MVVMVVYVCVVLVVVWCSVYIYIMWAIGLSWWEEDVCGSGGCSCGVVCVAVRVYVPVVCVVWWCLCACAWK